MQKCIWLAKHFPLQNIMCCQNTFLQQHQMHLHFSKKCILATNAFLHQMHFCTAEHFPLENVRQNAFWHQMHLLANIFVRHKCIFASNHFCIKYICNILLMQKCIWCQMHFCNAKQNVCIKCIFAQQNSIKCIFAKQQNVMQKYIFAKHQMHFCTYKIDAEHFPKENVRKNAFLHQIHFCKASNAFLHAYIFLWKISAPTKCDAEHFTKENVRTKCIFASNTFLQSIKCICNILFCWTFSKGKCSETKCDAEHFPLENVRKNAFLHQIYFCKASNAFVTFCFAEHFLKENVQHQQNVRAPRKRKNAVFFALQKVKKQSTAKNKGSAHILLVRCVHLTLQKCIWCCCVFCTAKNKGSAYILLVLNIFL